VFDNPVFSEVFSKKSERNGFSGLPGGLRYDGGTFDFIGKYGGWWSCTAGVALDMYTAWYCYLSYSGGNVDRHKASKGGGFSVRCLRD